MKLKSYKLLFQIFSFLSDKTNGSSLFVKYKLLLGTIILGIVSTPANAQKKDSVSRINPTKDVAAEITCYKPAKVDINTIIVSNSVTDQSGDPAIGATISVKGRPEYGVVTDIDGKFSITVHISDTLVFSYIGLKTKEMLATEITNAPIVLEDDFEAIEAILPPQISCYIGYTRPIDDMVMRKNYTVTDESGEPIIGASVKQKGTDKGAITDIDGRFSLDVTLKDTLVISFLGFKTAEIVVSGIGDKPIVLEEDDMILCYDPVVVPRHFYKKRK